MNRNLAINNAYIDGKPYLYFGAKRFNIEDRKRANEWADELKSQGYEVIFVDKKKTISMHVFKERSECGPVPCKSEVLDWQHPKFIIKSKGKNRYDIEVYKG